MVAELYVKTGNRSGTAEEELEEPKLRDLARHDRLGAGMARSSGMGFIPTYPTPAMQHAAHPVTTEVPPGFDGTTSWFKYSDAVEEWRDVTKVEARRRGPAMAARLSGRAETFKERLDRERLRDPERGVKHLLATLRPFFVKDLESVFLYRFFQMLRCNRGQTDHQRWTTQESASDRLRAEARQAWLGRVAGLQARIEAIAAPEASDAMRQAALETVWRTARRARINQFL